MKKLLISLLGIAMSIGFVLSQNNTMYLMKSGNVVYKRAVTEIDSVLLHKPARATASELRFPVRISANGRYLVDAHGVPFLLHGDTSWSLINQLTREEVEEYLLSSLEIIQRQQIPSYRKMGVCAVSRIFL